MLADGRGRVAALEDDSYGFLRFGSEVLPTLFRVSGDLCIYSTSFSYSIAPGLRVGVFVLPPELAPEVVARAAATFISPALLGQATVYEPIQRGALEPHLVRLRASLQARRDALLAAIDQHLANVVATRPSGGIFLQLRLAPELDAREVLRRAQGVTASAGADLGGASNTLRLNFAGPEPGELEPGIERLAEAL
jgi:2-aminoadipate transaminase